MVYRLIYWYIIVVSDCISCQVEHVQVVQVQHVQLMCGQLSVDGCAIMYSYPATNIAEMSTDTYRGNFLFVR